MQYAFQDKENLYLVMDFLGGGDLRYHIIKNFSFNEMKLKFIIACILVSLDYIHAKNILHRDIKPENLVFDENGYLHLTDFGISRIWSPKNENDTSGTPGYMAPEVMLKLGHGIACDLFAVGVIAYECMMGRRPYIGQTRKEIRDMIVNKQVKISPNDKPKGWSDDCVDFINKAQRLGNERPGIAKNHPWFNGFDWNALQEQRMSSPFQGIKFGDYDSAIINRKSTDEEPDDRNAFFRNQQIQRMFLDYNYDKDKEISKESGKHSKKESLSTNAASNLTEKTTKLTTNNTFSKNT